MKLLNNRENPYYYSFAEYCREAFGRRLFRVALDAGFTCPNRDGTLSAGGCIFCSNAGSGEYALRFDGQKLTKDDIAPLIGARAKSDGRPGDFIAYFQSFTNTYAPVSRLESLYRAALGNELFAGISIATRPDCVGEEVTELLVRLQADYPGKFIWIELGLQTMHEATAKLINRGYGLKTFEECFSRLKEGRIPVIVHVIIGLPGESRRDILETVSYLNKLHPDGIKLALLHIIKNTRLYDMYKAGECDVLTFEEYVGTVCDCLEILDKDIVIHRLTGDGSAKDLAAPLWSVRKGAVLNAVRAEMRRRA